MHPLIRASVYLLQMVPLLVLESLIPEEPDDPEEPDSDDPFLNLFSEIRDTLSQIRDRLPDPDELQTPSMTEPETPDNPETPEKPESLPVVESQPEPVKRRVPWGRKSV